MPKYTPNQDIPYNKMQDIYVHKRLNSLKDVIMSRNLFLATLEEITATLESKASQTAREICGHKDPYHNAEVS